MTKLVLSVVGFLLAGGIFFVYTQPTFEQIKAMRTEVGQYEGALSKSRELQQVRAVLLDKYKNFNPADLDRLEKLLPDHVDNVRLILDLDRLALSHQMPMQNVVIGDPTKEGSSGGNASISSPDPVLQKVGALTLTFSTVGTYEQFKSFLSDLEASLRIVDVVGLEISRGQSNQLSYKIILRTYWLK